MSDQSPASFFSLRVQIAAIFPSTFRAPSKCVIPMKPMPRSPMRTVIAVLSTQRRWEADAADKIVCRRGIVNR